MRPGYITVGSITDASMSVGYISPMFDFRRRGGEDLDLSQDAFRRWDETPDEEFYRTPRFVTHIHEGAIGAVTQLYREYFPAGGVILDLMSSLISHLPPEVEYRRVVGLGMNEAELNGNPRLDAHVVRDLNVNPTLPFEDGEFDGVGICVSIDYLTRPVEVLSEGTIPSGLKLVDSTVSTTGVVIGTYEPAGEIVTGSFTLD